MGRMGSGLFGKWSRETPATGVGRGANNESRQSGSLAECWWPSGLSSASERGPSKRVVETPMSIPRGRGEAANLLAPALGALAELKSTNASGICAGLSRYALLHWEAALYTAGPVTALKIDYPTSWGGSGVKAFDCAPPLPLRS